MENERNQKKRIVGRNRAAGGLCLMDCIDPAYRCTECRSKWNGDRICYDQCVVSPVNWCTFVSLYDYRLAWSRSDHYMHVLWSAGACPVGKAQKPVYGRFRYSDAGSLLCGGDSGISVVRDGADQLQADPDRWESGSILSVVNYTSGPDCDADIEISVRPKNCESSDTESDNGICNRIRGIYGYRQTDLRRPLGNGYHRLCFLEFRSVYDLSVHGRIRQSKDNTAEGGGIKWSSVKSCKNYEKAGR